MRFLVLASRDRKNRNFAGGDLTLTEVSERLASKGASVTYVCSRFPGASPEENINGVRILRVGNLWMASLLTLIFYLKNRHNFDAVIQEVIGGLRIPYFAALYVRTPLVAVWYQRNELIFRLQYGRIVAEVLKMLEYALARAHRSKLVLCPSRRTIRDLSHLGLAPERMRLYVPGMNEKILKLSNKASLSHREDLLIWLGKIRKYKCTEDAILTMDRLVKLVPSSRLLIVGVPEDEKYLGHLRELRDRLDLQRAVGFKFGVSEEEKGQLLLRTKALLVTSPIEGFANVVSEANACGAPAVVTDGVPFDVVVQGVNGFRVPFRDLDAMTDACRLVLTDGPMFSKLSRASVECAKDRSWDRTAEAFQDAIKDAIKVQMKGAQ
jgi:glycosyltransferase involved in cell wall biosynthesis